MSRMAYVLSLAISMVAGFAQPAFSADERAGTVNQAHNEFADWAGSSGQQLGLLEQYCFECHNSEDWAGGVAFDVLSLDELEHDAVTWEEAVRKLRAGLMPPQGNPRPPLATSPTPARSARGKHLPSRIESG